jgi:hypothetical protein
MNQTTDQEMGVPLDCDPALPGFKNDGPLVLHTGPMLRKKAGPMLGEGEYFLATLSLDQPDSVRKHPSHCNHALMDQVRVIVVLEDAKLINPPPML